MYLMMHHAMADIQISEEDVYDKLSHLDVNKSPGPDGWHPRFFKETAQSR